MKKMKVCYQNNILTFHIVLLAFLAACEEKKETMVSPNIIYILADDMGYGDLSIMGQQKFSTPNIDKLAAEGMLFTQHYAGSPVCAPSRSALMTGLHTGHTPIRGNKEIQPEGQHPLPSSYLTIAEILTKAGYTTGLFGKWGLGYPGSEGEPLKRGFDTFYGYNCQRVAHNYYPTHLWDNNNKIIFQDNHGGNHVTYAPHLIQQETLKFIEVNKDRPFFAYVPTTIPHAKLEIPKNYLANYKDKLEPEKLTPENLQARPYDRIKNDQSRQNAHETFAAMVHVLDEQVGEIVAKVKELGLEENTIIMFTSDNGPHYEDGGDPDYFDSNGIYRGYKRDLYEGGIRVPMIARWPGKIAPGTQSDHLSAFWDVLPTMTEIAGIETPQKIDGISFLPTLLGENENQQKHDFLYWEFPAMGGRKALRIGKWKTVVYDLKTDNPKVPELYDIESDPSEENNIADQYPEIVEEALSMMRQQSTPSDIVDWRFDD